MARERMVTRTIFVTEVTAMVADLKEAKVIEKTVSASGIYKDEKTLIKAVSKIVNTETQTFVKIISTNVVSELYGMTEQKFMENAEIISRDSNANVKDEVVSTSPKSNKKSK